MSYNGTGTFSINSAGQPVVTGTTITSTAFNTLTADLATGLSTALCKDGQSTPTANIGMGAFKITNLGAGTLATDAARLSQIQSGAATFVVASGTDTILGTGSPALTAYATGNAFQFTVASTNTGAATLNIDSLGAKAVTRDGSTALVAGDLVSGSVVTVVYDGTRFQVLNSNSKTNFNLSGTLTAASTATASKFIPTGTSATGNGMYLPTTDAVAFSTGGTERVRIDASGIVGIGGTPAAWINTYKAMQFGGVTANYIASSAGVFGLTNNIYVDAGGGKYITTGSAASRNYQLNGEHVWENAPSGTAGNPCTLTNRMKITAAGFVGIGTATPTGLLSTTNQISSGSLLTYAATNGVDGQNILNGYYAGGAYTRYLDIAAVGQADGTNGGSSIRFLTNPVTLNSTSVERMSIGPTGSVAIGTASNAGTITVNTYPTTNAVALAVTGATTASTQITLTNTGGRAFFGLESSVGNALLTGAPVYSLCVLTETARDLCFGTNNSLRMSIGTTGTVTMNAYGAGTATFSGAGVISSVSDETWKVKDGAPLNSDEMLQKLTPGYWFYNDEKKETFGVDRQLGFYAQNVNEAIGPEAAPVPEEGKPWGYYDRSVLAVTVMSLQKALTAIQEQQALIESLTVRIATLESK